MSQDKKDRRNSWCSLLAKVISYPLVTGGIQEGKSRSTEELELHGHHVRTDVQDRAEVP